MSSARGFLPLAIGNLTELITIELDNSDLAAGPIPESITLCTKLEHLILNHCKLEGVLPSGLSKLTSLGRPF
jgi:Leucine-rich repeat (LRR) protein